MVNDGDRAFLPGHAALDAVVCIGACELEGAFADGEPLLADAEASAPELLAIVDAWCSSRD